MFRRTLLIASMGMFLSACAQNSVTSAKVEQAKTPTNPPNIIFLIGDGMGFEFISAYRYALSQPGQPLAATPFDEMLVGAATTYPDDDTWVTDSAASATALATV